MQSGHGVIIGGFEGTQPPVSIVQKVADGVLGGVIFFARNIADLAEFSQVCARLQASRPAGSPPLILSIDQEGGRVQRIRAPLTVWPAMAKIAAIDDMKLSHQVGFAVGTELRAFGLNLDYAPVLDIHTNPNNPIIGDRAFGQTAPDVIRHALQFWRGLEAAGIKGCGKHFPGHGDSATDSHLELPVVNKTQNQLQNEELVPFQAACAANISMIMTAHIVYPQVDTRPATLSSVWLTQILRGQMGFQGVIVSDDLEMKAVSELQPAELTVEQSLLAGADCFLICRDEELQSRAHETLQKCAQDSAAFHARLTQARERVLALRQSLQADSTGWPAPEMLARHAELTQTISHRLSNLPAT